MAGAPPAAQLSRCTVRRICRTFVLQRWGLVLLRPEVGQPGEGCDALEQAALLYARAPVEAAAAAAAAVAERGGRLGPALQQQLMQQQQQMQRQSVANVNNALGWCLRALERQGREEEGQEDGARADGSAARVVAREVFGVGTERDLLHGRWPGLEQSCARLG